MLRNRLGVILLTALAPAIWGTTYLVTTELLPPGRPLLAGVLRALPAGLLLIAFTRQLPKGHWWWRAFVLGALNIGGFFALLFVAAYRLPGGVAATIGAVQPLLVAVLSSGLLGQRLTLRTVLTGLAGVAGVSLLVLRAGARLDGLGVAAALGSALVMATGVVLGKRWGSPAPLLATTGWQLVAGGLLLLPVMWLVEGPPPAHLTGANLLGYGYLTLVGAALSYGLWFRGLSRLVPTQVSFLGLLSPLVATLAGWLALGQELTPAQLLGGLIILGSLAAAQLGARTPAASAGAAGAAGSATSTASMSGASTRVASAKSFTEGA
ncbi:ABC transporter permease [Kitasatospora sp. MMS16-BH015]|uniref:EamA family transporter n=1 Tax=Kitasatospora sp. MMS16-BH015 TaxID=2018025 RepID=UPI000CA2CDE4|nr:EamA family transporter [Kitasatospora sp. MMS16-BH015]AUG75337.1 ABC transporter permease [Kitasatospora sp. MMS16-BH015]